jgi:N-acylneuraminate cytidylyltransferase
MNPVAIIPARGGSKRIPGKNIRSFGGRPMIAYPIAAARACGLFERILVSTDSLVIAEVAKDCGAEVPFLRPPELAGDTVLTVPVLVHALDWLRHHGGEPDLFCCIYPTAPFLTAADLIAGHDLLLHSEAKSAFAVTTFPYPILRALRREPNGRVAMLWPEHQNTRSQELPEAFHDAGQFYWFRTRPFLQDRVLFTDHALPVVLPRWRVQDIDTPEDWEKAELMFKARAPDNEPPGSLPA